MWFFFLIHVSLSSSTELSAVLYFSNPAGEAARMCHTSRPDTVTTFFLACHLSLASSIEVCSGEINLSELWQAGGQVGRQARSEQ